MASDETSIEELDRREAAASSQAISALVEKHGRVLASMDCLTKAIKSSERKWTYCANPITGVAEIWSATF